MSSNSIKKRLSALKGFHIIDTLPEKDYDEITRLAALICKAPMSLISILEKDRQFFKSHYGLNVNQTPITQSFCVHAIKKPHEIYIVPDARKDDLFKNNPLVTSDPNIVFYAGVSIITPTGVPLGTLNVMDTKPRKLLKDQLYGLKALAHQVVQLLELRKTQYESEKRKKTILEKKERLENILEATQVGTWEWNVLTGEVKVNERWAEMLGYTLEELEPVDTDTWYKFTHPDDHKISDEKVQECFDKKTGFYDIECRMFHKEGHIVWINDRGRVVEWSDDGQPLLMLGTHTDITERKNNERQLQTIADNIPGAVFRYIRNPNERDELTMVSKGAAELWGFTPNKVMENNLVVWERISKDDLDALLESIQTSAENLNYWTHEWRYNHPDGAIKWHKGSGNPTKWADGSIVWDCIILDITEKKEAERKIRYNERRFKALVQEGSELISVLDRDGKYIYTSPAASKILGYDPQELINKTAFGFIHPEDSEVVYQAFLKLQEEKQIKVKPFRFKHKAGDWRWLETIGTNMLDDPAIEGIVTNSRDVTEREKTFQVLKASEDRYKGFYESQTNYVVRTDMEGNYTYINKKFKEDFGWLYPDDKFLGSNSLTSILEYDHQKVMQVVEKCANTIGKVFKVELDKPTENGGIVSTLWDFVCIGDEQGQPSEIQCVGIDISDRIKFERELIKSNERFNLINKATNDAIYDWDMTNDTIYWGDGFKRLLGHSYAEGAFSFKNWIELTHPSDNEKIEVEWEHFVNDKTQTRWTNEYRFMRADGTYAYVEEIGYLIRNEKGKAVRMIGVLRDKTPYKIKEIQKQVERDIAGFFKDRTHNLNAILDNVLSYLVDFGNFKAAEIWLTGIDKKQQNLISTYSIDSLGEHFYITTKENKKLLLGEGLPGTVWQEKSIEIWDDIDQKKKFVRHKAANAAGLKSAIGIPLLHNENLVGVLVLLSEQPTEFIKENLQAFKPLESYLGAEIKRKQQEEEIQLFFDDAPEILAVVGPKGRFLKVNPAFCKLLEYSKEELTSQPFTNFIHPDDLNKTSEEYGENVQGIKDAKNFTNRYRTKKGTYKWISWNTSTVFGEEGLFYAYGRDITEMKKLQQLLENAAKMTRIGSWELDLRSSESNNMFWSSTTREILEVPDTYNPSYSAGLEFYTGEHKANIAAAVKRLIETGEPFDLELLIITGEGNSKWIRCIGDSERINGKCIKIFGSYQDIHQRKSAEIKLKETFYERNTILESIGDAFFAVDRDWIVTYWNKEAEKVLNTPKENVIGKGLWNVFPDAVGLKFYSEYHKAFETGDTVSFEEYYPATNNWFEVSAYPSKNGLSVYFRDVSQRKLAEEQIRQTNERFEKITEATNDAIWDFDVINNKLFWGKGFKTLFGYDPEAKPPTFDFLLSLIHPKDREGIIKRVNQFMTDGISNHWFEEYRFLKADGTYAFVIDRAIFIRNNEGNVERVVGAMTDISYRKEYEESLKKLNLRLKKHTRELEISNAELEQFAYVASHDLQEPLRMVSSFLTQLERKYGDVLDEKARQYIHFAVDGAKRMRQIILDLLQFSRVSNIEEEKEKVDLNEVIGDFLLLRQKVIQEKNAIVVSENLPIISTYKTPISQVFHNLLDNALKYHKEGVPPKIKIAVKDKKDHWQFSIKDNGIGIEEAYFEKIFVIFQRLHDKETYDGTGIGLAIVKKILENLNERIWVTSEVGKGTTIYFSFKKE
jgi:PAS domain S-box-containing protein